VDGEMQIAIPICFGSFGWAFRFLKSVNVAISIRDLHLNNQFEGAFRHLTLFGFNGLRHVFYKNIRS